MIDWTKPCETNEDPPRPVRVLCTDNDGAWPVVVSVGGWTALFDADGTETPQRGYPKIRNVAPKPVRHEYWVNLYADGTSISGYQTRTKADDGYSAGRIAKDRVECRRIVWNSDGSPMEDETDWRMKYMEAATHCARFDELEKDRDAWKAKAEEALRLLTDANTRRDQDVALIEQLEADLAQSKRNEHSLVCEIARQREAHAEQVKRMQGHSDVWKSEYDRMKPVVDAAIAWQNKDFGQDDGETRNLIREVISYNQGEPEKSCENCGNFTNQNSCAPGNGLVCIHSLHAGPAATDKWEPRR